MRYSLLKLKKDNSTKGERRIGELLKKNRIKFKSKWKIGKYEVDFMVGKMIIEIDGSVHKRTNTQRDIYFTSQGYIPIHIITSRQKTEAVEKDLLRMIKSNSYGEGYR
jgi:very-short-patch-repair endonuclease